VGSAYEEIKGCQMKSESKPRVTPFALWELEQMLEVSDACGVSSVL